MAKKRGGAGRVGGGGSDEPRPPPSVSMRIGGRLTHGYAARIPPGRGGPDDPNNPYASIPGGGDEEAARLVVECGRLGMSGDLKGAKEHLRRILERFPDHYIANYNMGNLLRLEGNPRRGIKYLKRAIRVWPENKTAHGGLGRALLDMGEYERAIRALDRALALQPDDPLALKDKAEALRAIRAEGRGGGGSAAKKGSAAKVGSAAGAKTGAGRTRPRSAAGA